MGFGLQAPAAVPVELRGSRRRVFRLSRVIGEEGVCLEKPAPFERGEPVEIRLSLPDAHEPLTLRATVQALDDDDARAEVGGRGLRIIAMPHGARQALRDYVARRLGLPPW
jgi:PilZ domain